MSYDGSVSDASSHADVEEDSLSTRKEILDLLGGHFRDAVCTNLARDIRALPSEDLVQLQVLIQRVANSGRASSLSKEEWKRSVLLFDLEVLRSLHIIVKRVLMGYLTNLGRYAKYWRKQLDHQILHYIQQGPQHWYSLRPKDFMQTGIKPWLTYVAYQQRNDISDTIQKIELLQAKFFDEAARLHCSLSALDNIQLLDQDFEALEDHAQKLQQFLSYKPVRRIAGPFKLLRLLEDIVYAIPEFQLRVDTAVRPLEIPSHFKRKWPLYAVSTTAVLVVARTLYQYRETIYDNAKQYRDGFMTFLREHLIEPTSQMFNYIFKTFRDRPDGDTGEGLDQSKSSLQTMLSDYGTDHAAAIASEMDMTKDEFLNALSDRASNLDMDIVMKKYSSDIRHPVSSALHGDLIRGLLIQIQQMKVHSETAMVQLDQILKANEINFQMLATIPAIVVIGGMIHVVRLVYLSPSEHRSLRRMRLCLRRVEALLIKAHERPDLLQEDIGRLLLLIYQFENHMHILPPRAQTMVREDLAEVQSLQTSPRQKLKSIERIYRTFPYLVRESA